MIWNEIDQPLSQVIVDGLRRGGLALMISA